MALAPQAAIVGCAGLRLTQEERRLFASQNPFGLILFARNVESASQITALTQEFRACVGRADAPVLIDQEGGRVARLRPPLWDEFPPAAVIGRLYQIDPVRGVAAAKILGRLLAAQLRPMGINVDCTPVLDLRFDGADNVIGDRAFSGRVTDVAALSRAVCDGLRVGGVLPVLKHIPGHGRATADSHEKLPVVRAALADLQALDFAPFKALHDMPLAMTAHILYPALDNRQCATLSAKVIGEVIRTEIGFDGLLLSDDLCMKALEGDIADLGVAALAAGCDVALYCKHDLNVMAALLDKVGPLTPAAQQRWAKALAWLRPMDLFDPALAKAELNQLIAHV